MKDVKEIIKKELIDYISSEYADIDNQVVTWDQYANTKTGLQITSVGMLVDNILSAMKKNLSDYFNEDDNEVDAESLVNDYKDYSDIKIFNPLITKINYSGYDGDPNEILADGGEFSIKNVESFVHSLYCYLKDIALPLTEEKWDLYLDDLLESGQVEGTNSFEISKHMTQSGNPVTIYFNCRFLPIIDDRIVNKEQADEAERYFTQIEF